MSPFLFLPLLAWIAFFLVIRQAMASGGLRSSRPLAAILTSVAWGVALTLVTELTSAFHGFNRLGVALTWSLLLGCACAALKRDTKLLRRAVFGEREHQKFEPRGRGNIVRILCLCSAALVLLLGALAAKTSTTNWDSMTYHLPRVMHWIANSTVAHYRTADFRQLAFGPWDEFALAHVVLLGGNDKLVNLVQWTSMVLSLLAVCLLYLQLRPMPPSTQPATPSNGTAEPSRAPLAIAFTLLFAVTLPIGIAESISTQNDYVLAAWLLHFVVLAVASMEEPLNVWYAWGAGLALGLGILTKATIVPLALPFLAAWLVVVLRKLPTKRHQLRLLGILVAATLAPNVPHLARNFKLYGSVRGPAGMFTLLVNESFSPGAVASNVIRNLSLETATPIPFVSKAFNDLLHLGLYFTGRPPNDPATTFTYTPFSFQREFVVGDSAASNPLHLVLALLAVFFLPLLPKSHRGLLPRHALLAMAGFVLLCANLRWQPWHARFHLSVFLLLAPFVGHVLVSTLSRLWVGLLSVALLVIAWLSVFGNVSRPLAADHDFLALSREQQYFLGIRSAYPLYARLAEDIAASNCDQVALRLAPEGWEYPLWAFLRKRGFSGTLQNISVGAPFPPETGLGHPCALVTSDLSPPGELRGELTEAIAYGGLKCFWSPKFGHWASLTHLGPTAEVVRTEPESKLAMPDGRAGLSFRTLGYGALELTAAIVDSAGTPLRSNAIRVKTADAGEDLPVDGTEWTVTLPIAPGETPIDAILLTPLPAGTQAELRITKWRWKPGDTSWGALLSVVFPNPYPNPNPYGPDRWSDGDRFFWMGRGTTTLNVITRALTGSLTLRLNVISGPSLPGTAERRLLVATPPGFRQEIVVRPGQNAVTIPFTGHRSQILLTPLDSPTVHDLPNGDPRPLLVGIKGRPEIVVSVLPSATHAGG